MMSYDIVIVGGGPAGLAAAISARKAGIDKILILERDKELGGILNQCIHNGFGLHTFKEELTGPEYAYRYIEQVLAEKIEYKLNTMVVDISDDRVVTAMSKQDGMYQIKAGAVIFSAGTAQRLVNMEGYMPGREVVILGSGDIGLIMARRMTLEGAKVKVVAEIMPYSGGLKRNIVQCLDDYGIPLKLSHTVVDIEGKEHVSAVTIAEVDANMKPIPGTEERYTCDTLLLSVGLIPENELSNKAGVKLSPITSGPIVNESLETNIPGIFACGNVLHVHDLVDYVSEEAEKAGANAAKYVKNGCKDEEGGHIIEVKATDGARYTVPTSINVDRMEDLLTVRFRVGNVYKNCFVNVYFDDEQVQHLKKRILAPGEMEQFIVQKKQLEGKDVKTITVKIEAE